WLAVVLSSVRRAAHSEKLWEMRRPSWNLKTSTDWQSNSVSWRQMRASGIASAPPAFPKHRNLIGKGLLGKQYKCTNGVPRPSDKAPSPSSKLQRNCKQQTPKSVHYPGSTLTFRFRGFGFFCDLRFGIWCFSGAWFFVLGSFLPLDSSTRSLDIWIFQTGFWLLPIDAIFRMV